jgi:hypothetical protein
MVWLSYVQSWACHVTQLPVLEFTTKQANQKQLMFASLRGFLNSATSSAASNTTTPAVAATHPPEPQAALTIPGASLVKYFEGRWDQIHTNSALLVDKMQVRKIPPVNDSTSTIELLCCQLRACVIFSRHKTIFLHQILSILQH